MLLLALLLLIVPGFLLAFFIMKKKDIEKGRWFSSLLIGLASAPILGILIFFVGYTIVSYHPERDFSEIRWHKYPDKRYEMSKYILENDLFIGSHSSEIKERLGDPDSKTKEEQEELWSYRIGLEDLYQETEGHLYFTLKNDTVSQVGY